MTLYQTSGRKWRSFEDRSFGGTHVNLRPSRLAVALLLMVGFAACGDDDTSEDASSSATTAAADDTATTTAGSETTTGGSSTDSLFPAEFDVNDPLPEAPPEGQTVAWLECSVPACQIYTQGFRDATEALGWNLEVIPFDQTNPAVAFQQAIDVGADYVTSTAIAAALIEEQLQQMQDAGIPFFSLFSVDDPDPENNNIVFQAGGTEFYRSQGEALADWVMEDSGGDANVVYVNIRDLQILNFAEEGLGDKLGSDCDGCSFDVLPVTFDDLGSGEVPQLVASYLQSNPDTNYVLFAFSDLSRGVSETLAGAGLGEGVQIGGTINDALNTQAIVDGDESGWTAQAVDYMSWLAVDGMARTSVGVPLDQDYLDAVAVVPTFVITDETAQTLLDETEGLWEGPEGFRDHFTQLWGV